MPSKSTQKNITSQTSQKFPTPVKTISKKDQKIINDQNIRDREIITAPLFEEVKEVRPTYRTQACKFVSNGSEKFGVCWKVGCTFAHGIDELEAPPCLYGDDCYHQQEGSRTVCIFKHPSESVLEFFKRIKKPVPHLPQTASRSTKKPDAPKPKIDLNPPQPVKLQTLVKIPSAVQQLNPWQKSTKSQEKKAEKIAPSLPKKKEEASSLPRKTEDKPETKSTDSKTREIEVPRELAEFTIKSLIEKGDFNFKLKIL